MKCLLAVLIALSGLLFGGCISSGTKVEQSATTQIQKGKTTREQVLALFGPPQSATFTDEGKEILTWNHGQMWNRPEGFIPFVGIFVAGTRENWTTFQVLLDKNKIVEDTLWNTAQTETKVFETAQPPWPNPKVAYASPAEDVAAKAFAQRPADKAVLYVYRESHFAGMGVNFQLYLDGSPFAVIGSGSFASAVLDPKEHVLRVVARGNTQDVRIDATAGKSYFYKLETRSAIRVEAAISTVDEPQGMKGVSDARLVSTVLAEGKIKAQPKAASASAK